MRGRLARKRDNYSPIRRLIKWRVGTYSCDLATDTVPLMITTRQAQLAFVPLMVAIMSAVISFVLTAWNLGLTADFPAIWLQNWGAAALVALPTAWFVVPRLKAALERATRPPNPFDLEMP
jgi:hypothetical protein